MLLSATPLAADMYSHLLLTRIVFLWFFSSEYIPPVIAHLEQIGIVTESDGAKVS